MSSCRSLINSLTKKKQCFSVRNHETAGKSEPQAGGVGASEKWVRLAHRSGANPQTQSSVLAKPSTEAEHLSEVQKHTFITRPSGDC